MTRRLTCISLIAFILPVNRDKASSKDRAGGWDFFKVLGSMPCFLKTVSAGGVTLRFFNNYV